MISPVIPIAAFVLFFPLFWCFVCFLLSKTGGWSRLAENYRTLDKPTGKKISMMSGRIGQVNYNNVLTLYGTKDGFYLSVMFLFRVGHPALFIPWDAIENVRPTKLLWMEYMNLDMGTATIKLPKKTFEALLLEKTA